MSPLLVKKLKSWVTKIQVHCSSFILFAHDNLLYFLLCILVFFPSTKLMSRSFDLENLQALTFKQIVSNVFLGLNYFKKDALTSEHFLPLSF